MNRLLQKGRAMAWPGFLAAFLLASAHAQVPVQFTPLTTTQTFSPIPVSTADGKYSVFRTITVSGAQVGNIFLLNRETQVLQQVDITPSGQPSSPKSGMAVISGNGRFVVFASIAPEMGLPATPANGSGYFLRDLQLGTTQKIASAVWSGGFPRINPQMYAGISHDGRYVVYRVDGGPSRLHVWDRLTQTSTVTSAPNAAATSLNDRLYISSDGRFISYRSMSSTAMSTLQVHDRLTGLNERIDVNTAGQPAPDNTGFQLSMSDDGNIFAFQSTAGILTPGGETVQNYDVYVRNRAAGTTERISASAGTNPSISPDGRFVAFYGRVTQNGQAAIWVYDTLAHAARAGFTAQTTWFIHYPSLSANGRFLTMYSHPHVSQPHIVTLDYGDPAAVVLSTNNVTLTEGGLAATYGVSLSRVPSANVTVTVTPDTQLTASPTQLTFTTANWNVPQLVSVQAVHDNQLEGLHYGSVAHAPTSSDPFYAVASAGSVQAAITDPVAPAILQPGTPGRPLQSGDVTLNGTAAPNATVLVTLTESTSGNIQAVSVVANGEGQWLYTFLGLANGGYSVSAEADGIQGNNVAFSVYAPGPDQ